MPFKKNGNKPLTPVQGWLMGNAGAESGMNPKRVQGDKEYNESTAKSNVGGYAIGLWQWDGGRRPGLLKFADEKGETWYDLVNPT